METNHLQFGPFIYNASRESISVLNRPEASRVVSYKDLKSSYSDTELAEHLDALGSYISKLSKNPRYTPAVSSADYSIFSIRINIDNFFKLDIYDVSSEFINEIANSRYFNFEYLKQTCNIGKNILNMYSALSDEVKLKIELS